MLRRIVVGIGSRHLRLPLDKQNPLKPVVPRLNFQSCGFNLAPLAAKFRGISTIAVMAMAEQQSEGHKHTNRLAGEHSPYLLQHAHNPVDWYPWGEEAFAKARIEKRPIFLSIGYSTCHWCHVMEVESFENEEVAKLLNDWFVSIKVDREERPDVDKLNQLVKAEDFYRLNKDLRQRKLLVQKCSNVCRHLWILQYTLSGAISMLTHAHYMWACFVAVKDLTKTILCKAQG